MEIRPLEPRDQPALQAFLRRIPESDKTFFKEPIDDEAPVASWFAPGGARWLAVDGVVEVLANQEFTIGMFRALGFDPEALLTGQVRDRNGALQDLMILAHTADEALAALAATGLAGMLN
jgi:hypothetical protein